jgi:hypothetical protein
MRNLTPATDALVYEFVQAAVADSPKGSPGMFGLPVEVGADAALLDRLLARTGRHPGWRPPGRT